MNRKIPTRKCIGCGELKEKNQLVRIVRSKEGEISLDMTGKKNSRGFAVKAANESEYAQLLAELDAVKEGKEALNDTFFNKWTDFGTYRKIVFKDEVWDYVI